MVCETRLFYYLTKMADAMLHKEKGDKTPKSSFEDDLLRLNEDEIAYEGKGKGPAKGPAKRKCSKPIVSKSSTGSDPKVNVTRTLKERLW